MRRAFWFFVLSACGDDAAPMLDAGLSDSGMTTSDAGPPPAPAEGGWCAGALGGPPGDGSAVLGLSALHAGMRYFGVASSNREIDDALVAAMRVDEDRLERYSAPLDGVCLVRSNPSALGAARVEREGGVAIVRPGDGAIDLSGASAIVLDLRDLAETPELASAIERAVSEAIASPLPPAGRVVHVRSGLTDEAFVPSNTTYFHRIERVELASPAANASSERPLVVLVGSTIAPSAALFAARLRVANRAWLAGSDVDVRIAESRWEPAGAIYRYSDLVDDEGRFPDLVARDFESLEAAGDLASLGAPPPLVRTATRAEVLLRDGFGEVQDQAIDPAVARAALVSAHGAAKLFFPYFEVIGDHTDERLMEALGATASVADREALRQILRRFWAVIEDGHGWVVDQLAGATGILPVVLDPGTDLPLVARSYTPELEPGDALVTIDGVAAPAWFETEAGRTYGATPGFRFVTAAQELVANPPSELVVRSAAGAERTVTIAPRARPPGADLFAGSLRAHGPLADLGAADVFYMNLDGCHVGGKAAVEEALASARTARALVLDMRGHPANCRAMWDPYTFLRRVVRVPFDTPRYRVPLYRGPDVIDATHPFEASYTPLTDSLSYEGQVILVTDHQAVSFAEDFGMMIVAPGTVTVVGRTSAGTTGSVTGMQLPGGFAVFLTGMEARWPDGSVFFARGVIPDVVVSPTAADLAGGRDRFLEAAIAAVER